MSTLTIVLILLLPAGLLGIWFLLRPLLMLWRIHKSTAPVRAGGPPSGRIAVSGVVSGSRLHSPLTATVCVYWELEVWQRRRSSITKIYAAASTEPLLIDDGR